MLGDIAGKAADEAALRLDAGRGRVAGTGLDVRSAESFGAAIAWTIGRYGHLDVLVNNAAVTVRRPFFEIDDAEWDEVLAVNLRGVFLGCRLAGQLMRERGSGRIVNVSSLAGQAGGLVNGAHYAASKAGILALTKVVARELAADGVTVNAVAPAAIDGPAMAALPGDQVEALTRSIPVGRLGYTRRGRGARRVPRLRRCRVRDRRDVRRQRRSVDEVRRATGAPPSSARSTREPGSTPSPARAMTTGPGSVATEAILPPSRCVVTCSATPPAATISCQSRAPQRGHNTRTGKTAWPQRSQT